MYPDKSSYLTPFLKYNAGPSIALPPLGILANEKKNLLLLFEIGFLTQAEHGTDPMIKIELSIL